MITPEGQEQIEEIEDYAKTRFANLEKPDRIAVASALSIPDHEKHIPFGAVFQNEGIETACETLLTVIHTPTKDTPFYRPDLVGTINNIRERIILTDFGSTIRRAVANRIQLMAGGHDYYEYPYSVGNPMPPQVNVYRDYTRFGPYDSSWISKLRLQFGTTELIRMIASKDPLLEFLGLEELLRSQSTTSRVFSTAELNLNYVYPAHELRGLTFSFDDMDPRSDY